MVEGLKLTLMKAVVDWLNEERGPYPDIVFSPDQTDRLESLAGSLERAVRDISTRKQGATL